MTGSQNLRPVHTIRILLILSCTGYAFVMSTILAYGINLISGLHLRTSEEAELLGMDDDQLGEFAYDYVELRRDYPRVEQQL
jgi:Amt family ammonium transporter